MEGTTFSCLIATGNTAISMDYLPVSFDWVVSFRPAALAMLHGGSPYDGFGYYNPPWMLLPFIPIALLPEAVGRLFVLLSGLSVFFYVAYKFNRSPIVCALFMVSYPVLGSLNTAGLDWFSMLGFVMPAPLGLIFAATKPQIGLGISLYWLVQSWRSGGIRSVVRNFLPVTILFLGSVLLYGPWFVYVSGLEDATWNVSIFPFGVPIGLTLLWMAFNKDRLDAAIAASPFLSPYYSGSTLAVLLVPLLKNTKLFLFGWVCLWAFHFLRNFRTW